MKIKSLVLATVAAASCLAAVPASAAPFLFELTGSRNATFIIDTTTPRDFQSTGAFGDQISYNSVAGTFGGTMQNAQVGFGTNIFAQLNIGGTPLGFTQFGGPDLFSLVNGSPVFKVGTFTLNSIVSGSSSLRISAATAAVPEPATWAMMLVGFGSIGYAMRRRAKVRTTVQFV
ncbi:MAG: PEPxxWA-CTERM sorting domain-containing protein [Pseudomonadota bacterium]